MSPIIAASPWAPAALALVGTAIGAIASIAGGAFSQWFIWQKERQAVAAALAREVRGFVDIVDSSQIRSLLLDCIDRTKSTGQAFIYSLPIDDHPFPVFEQNVNKIGFLPADLADKAAEFYTYARRMAVDLRSTHDENWSKWPAPEAVRFMESIIQRIDFLSESAKVVVPELKKEAARTWQDYLQPT
jgi:hypothetical protein